MTVIAMDWEQRMEAVSHRQKHWKWPDRESWDKLCEQRNELTHCSTLDGAVSQIHSGTFCHALYRHYTTLDALLGIIRSNSMWLTLGRSAKLDDSQEREKFGSPEVWKRTYISCFVHDAKENAAMWGLYCRGDEEAVSLAFPAESMKAWADLLRKMATEKADVLTNPNKGAGKSSKATIEYADIVDMAYADVGKSLFSSHVRENFVFWDGAKSQPIQSIRLDAKDGKMTGLLKDCEWSFESETRVIVRLAAPEANTSKIQIPLPSELLESISITFGPWLKDGSRGKYERKLEEALLSQGIYTKIAANTSTLSGALNKWRCKRKAGGKGKKM